jgi:DNA polymerase III delta subunit
MSTQVLRASEFFKLYQKNPSQFVRVMFEGHDPFIEQCLRDLPVKKGFEKIVYQMPKTGPDGDFETEARTTSMFSSARLLWLPFCSAPSGWSAANRRLWDHLQLDWPIDDLLLWVQVKADKRVKWDGFGHFVRVSIDGEDAAERSEWLDVIASKAQFKLGSNEKQFLLAFEADLLEMSSWVELWALGGNVWAEKSLGWLSNVDPKSWVKLGAGDNPAYLWVESVLRGDAKNSRLLVTRLLRDGSEPLQLLSLLTKSLKIFVGLELDVKSLIQGQPPFLIDKVRRSLGQGARSRSRSRQLLGACLQADRKLKLGGDPEILMCNLV